MEVETVAIVDGRTPEPSRVLGRHSGELRPRALSVSFQPRPVASLSPLYAFRIVLPGGEAFSRVHGRESARSPRS